MKKQYDSAITYIANPRLSLIDGGIPLNVFPNHQQANLLDLPNFYEAVITNFGAFGFAMRKSSTVECRCMRSTYSTICKQLASPVQYSLQANDQSFNNKLQYTCGLV